MRNHQNYQTALGAKLSDKLGMDARDVRFSVALSEFFNHGGTVERAYELVALAAERMGKSAKVRMPEGQDEAADAPRIDAAKGQGPSADKAVADMPDAAPRNKPGHAKRGIAAISAVQETVSRSLFDTTKLPDGRSLREVRWAEVPQLAQRYTFLARVMLLVHRKAVPADPAATLDNIVSEAELTEIIGSVEKLNDLQ